MPRNLISLFAVLIFCLTLVLTAAAAPITVESPVSQRYTGSGGSSVVETAPASYLQQVAAAVYDYAKHRAWIWAAEEQEALDGRADPLFDY